LKRSYTVIDDKTSLLERSRGRALVVHSRQHWFHAIDSTRSQYMGRQRLATFSRQSWIHWQRSRRFGFQWRHFGAKYKDKNTDYRDCGVDQLKNVINTIKNNPNDRRMIICSWNPIGINEELLLISLDFQQISCFLFCLIDYWRHTIDGITAVSLFGSVLCVQQWDFVSTLPKIWWCRELFVFSV
jgi:hypothetical protein